MTVNNYQGGLNMTISSPLCRMLLAAACTLLVLGIAHAEAPAAAELAPVAALGRLNGVALACKQPALTARLREIVVAHAPKSRAVGEAYEQASNQAFLDQGAAGRACPDGKALTREIDAAEAGLKAAFAQ